MNYFKKMKEFYKIKQLETPILDDIIKGEKKINFNLFILRRIKICLISIMQI